MFHCRYSDIRKTHDVLDSITCENALIALSLTKNWKETMKLLDEIKCTCAIPSGISYSALVSAAFRNNQPKLAWKFLNETIGKFCL